MEKVFGAVAQLGERLDGIQKVVGSIPSSSTNYKILCLIFFSLITKNVFAETVESYKLLIPGETFRNDNQKKNEINNYLASGISYEQWRQKKCYKKAFVIFQSFSLCSFPFNSSSLLRAPITRGIGRDFAKICDLML